MANITLTTTENSLVVDATNNIIQVNSTPTTVVVGESAIIDNAQIRGALSNVAPILYNEATGVFSLNSAASFIGKTTDDLPEAVSAPSNLYFTAARARQQFARQNVSGDGRLEYNSGNGIFSYYGPEAANYRAVFSAVSPLNYNSASGAFSIDANAVLTGSNTDSLAEGTTNLYFTAARARGNVSAVDAGGLGSFTYSSSTGAFTYTGPSDSDVRSLVSATTATGISYNSTTGVFSLASIPNSSLTNSAITINGTAVSLGGTRTLTTTDIAEGTNLYFTAARANSNVVSYIGTVPLTVGGNLTVNGNINATGNINVQNVEDLYVRDQTIVMNANAASPANVQIVSNRPGLANTELKWNEQTDRWTFTNDGTTYYNLPTSTSDVSEGTNLYFTAARARGNVSATTATGITYDSGTGVFSLAGIPNSSLTNSSITINGKTVALGSSNTMTTSDISEGANLYYTTARANTAIGAYQGSINTAGNITASAITATQGVISNANIIVNYPYGIQSNSYPTLGFSLTPGGLDWSGSAAIDVGPTGTVTWGSTGFVMQNPSSDGIFSFRTHGDPTSNTSYPRTLLQSDQTYGIILGTSSANVSTAKSSFKIIDGLRGGVEIATGGYQPMFEVLYNGKTTIKNDLFLQANTRYGVLGNVTAAGNVTAGNVNTNNIYASNGNNLTLNTANGLITQQKYSNTNVFSGNISSDGYALFAANQYTGEYVTYTGSANIENYVFEFGSTTAGSNAITGVSLLNYFADTPESLSNAQVGLFIQRVEFDTIPFPIGTRVTSVDAANSIIYVSQNATATTNISLNLSAGIAWGLAPALHDTETGLTIGLVSEYDAQISASKTTLAYDPSQGIVGTYIFTQSIYGYPATGPVITDFDFTSAGTTTDYSLGPDSLSPLFIGRNKIESPKSVFQAPRGLIVGESADLTNRAENDTIPSFGVNVLWDGQTDPTEYNGNTPLTQILVKNYTDNNLQSTNRTNLGPRLMFIAAEGNASESIAQTYPLKNLELGRVSWWSTSSTSGGLSTSGPPAWISGVAGQDCVNNNSGVGMYFGISPNTNNFSRSLFLASSMGNTLIASAQDSTGTHRPIIFAPSYFGSEQGNSALLYNQTIIGSDPNTSTNQTSGAHFAQINYNNTSALTGAKISVTNGNNFNSNREGNIALSIDRNLTSANANVRVRTGGTNYLGSSNPDRVRFTFAPDGLVDGTAVTITGFTNATVAGALNGNVFYVKGPFASGGFRDYELYTDSGLTTGVNLGVSNIQAGQGYFEYTRNNGVTAKEWTWVLPQGSNDLILAEDGVTTTTFASGGNVSMNGNLTITGRHTYDRVYGEFFSNVAQTANAANTPTAITLNNTGISSDVSIVDNSNITIAKPGFYNLQFSLQLSNSDNSGEHDFDVWLRKNGTNVPNSNTQYTVVRGRSGADGKNVAALNLFLDAAAGDVYQIMFAVTNTAVSIETFAELTTPYARPATPSAIVTVTPIGA